MLCIPKANHQKLFEDCYPAVKALAGTAPEYRPNSNELGRLCYYAQSKPAKLTKVGRLLTVRAAAQCRAFRAAPSDKTKAPLMITLGILKELVATCGEGHVYMAPTIRSVLTEALQVSSSPTLWDADVNARAVAVFAIYVESLEPADMEIDDIVSRTVLDVLAELRQACASAAEDERAYVNSLAGMDAIVRAPIFTTSALPRLHGLIGPCVLQRIHASYSRLDGTAALPSEPSLIEITPSTQSTSSELTANVALTVLHHILVVCDAVHLRTVVQQMLAWIDEPDQGRAPLWDAGEWPVWLLALVAQWAPKSSRYVVPHTIVDALATPMERSSLRETRLLQALHVILANKTEIVGLNVTEMFDGHVHFLLAHIQRDAQDPAIQATIEAVGHLASHTVYTEQLGDFVQQMTPHLQRVQQDERLPADTQTVSLCALLYCLHSIFRAPGGALHVPLSSWAGTEALLLSPSSAVRATYLQVLLVYLQYEQSLGLHVGASDTLSESLEFLHSLAAHMWILASAHLPGAADALDPALVHVPSVQLKNLQSAPSDFVLLRGVLDLLVIVAPAPATLALVPALFGLERVASAPAMGDLLLVHQTLACRWLVGGLLAQMCAVWQSQRGVDYLHYQVLPSVQAIQFPAPALPERFQLMSELPPFTSGPYHQAPQSPMDLVVVSDALAASAALQSMTYVDHATLQAWFLRPWTVRSGLDDARSSARPTWTRWAASAQPRTAEGPPQVSRGPSMSVSQLRMALANPGSGAMPEAPSTLSRTDTMISEGTRGRFRSRSHLKVPGDISNLLNQYSGSQEHTATAPAPSWASEAPSHDAAPSMPAGTAAPSMPVGTAAPLSNVAQQLGVKP
ncbi:plasma membrane localization protein [Malassezia caprae]|uniref:Plasma membrane localization protein n=1 Tax=Malassezia caprae TaxID=1381934 RepID=A0AAF0E4Y0_9BASI|nr:plasma membrane localization protein [Malassezia caprae]